MTRHITSTRRSNTNIDNVTVIILAANINYGMKSYGAKSLINVNSKETLIEYQIRIIRESFVNPDIIIVVGFSADRVIKKCPSNVRIVENINFENTNEIEQLRLALNCSIYENALIIKDDVIFNVSTLKNVVNDRSFVVYDSQGQIDSNNIGINVINGFATFFTHESLNKWCHITYLINKELKIIRGICNNREKAKLYLFEALNLMLEKTEKIHAIEPHNMKILKIDNSKCLAQIKE